MHPATAAIAIFFLPFFGGLVSAFKISPFQGGTMASFPVFRCLDLNSESF